MDQIDSNKMKLLEDFQKLSEGKSTEELIPLVLAFMDKAKKENISFSKEEVAFLMEKL